MIGKIMSEASHSIIGMLSAKPLDMETRTANNEFSSLLLPGEDRSRLVVQDDTAEMTKDARGEQFLEQFVSTDVKPEVKVDGPDIPKTVGLKVSIEPSNGDTELASEGSSPTSPAVSETDRFISHLLPTTTESAAKYENAPLTVNPSTMREFQTGISTDDSTTPDQAYLNANGPRPAGQPGTVTSAEKARLVLSEVGKVVSIPLTFVDGPALNKDVQHAADTEQKPVIRTSVQNPPVSPTEDSPEFSAGRDTASAEIKPFVESGLQDKRRDPDMSIRGSVAKTPSDIVQKEHGATAEVTTTTVPDAETPLPLSPKQAAGSERKINNLLDLRVDSNNKADDAALRQISETETLKTAINAPEKQFKIEAKPFHLEIEKPAVFAPLGEDMETVPAAQSTAVIGGQTVTQKTVSFDWNAPQFAERFASAVSDLRINGDLKRFEINPKNMGRLEISLVAQGANEILQIEAESDAARDVIAQHSQAIQEILKGQGRSDLILRVDVKENMLSSSSPNQDMNFEQQDSANARQNDSTPSPNLGASTSTGEEDRPQNTKDNGRYA